MASGVTYDQHTTKATVVVTDDTAHPGKLKASVTYNNGTVSDKTDKAVFENKYEASFAYETTGGLLVEKSAERQNYAGRRIPLYNYTAGWYTGRF